MVIFFFLCNFDQDIMYDIFVVPSGTFILSVSLNTFWLIIFCQIFSPPSYQRLSFVLKAMQQSVFNRISLLFLSCLHISSPYHNKSAPKVFYMYGDLIRTTVSMYNGIFCIIRFCIYSMMSQSPPKNFPSWISFDFNFHNFFFVNNNKMLKKKKCRIIIFPSIIIPYILVMDHFILCYADFHYCNHHHHCFCSYKVIERIRFWRINYIIKMYDEKGKCYAVHVTVFLEKISNTVVGYFVFWLRRIVIVKIWF